MDDFLNMFYVCVLGNGYMIYATRLECPQIGVCFMDYKYKVLLRKKPKKALLKLCPFPKADCM